MALIYETGLQSDRSSGEIALHEFITGIFDPCETRDSVLRITEPPQLHRNHVHFLDSENLLVAIRSIAERFRLQTLGSLRHEGMLRVIRLTREM